MNHPLPAITDPALAADWERLVARLRQVGRPVVAYSGGVDSSLVLGAAGGARGDQAAAAICLGAFTPPWEAARARVMAAELGVPLWELDCDELAHPALAANPPERCYLCKRLRLGGLVALARERGYAAVVDGGQGDDLKEHRPGHRAVRELGVLSPLSEVGLAKAQVRGLSRALGLITAGVPSSACLATRLPTGTPLTVEALGRVARAEAAVRELLPGQLRVRDHHPIARLELAPELIPLAAAPEMRPRLLAALTAAGYRWACLDLLGYRTGGAD